MLLLLLFLYPAFEETLQHPDLKVDLGLCAVNLAVQYKRWLINNSINNAPITLRNTHTLTALEFHPYVKSGTCSQLCTFSERGINSRKFSGWVGKGIVINLFCYVLTCRTELAFDCLKTLASRFKNSPDLYKIQLEHLVSFKYFCGIGYNMSFALLNQW